MRKVGNVLWGVVLIAIGIIWGLNSLGITNIDVFFDGWWTLFIIIPCFIGLFKGSNRTGDLIGLCIGVALLLCAQGYLSFSMVFKLAVPIILVLIGLSLIFGNFIHGKINKKIRELNKNGMDGYTATFGEQRVNLAGEEFKGTNLDAIFGSVTLNIKDAVIKEDQVINASAIFGGIDIIAPSNVIIKVKSTPIFGGVSNKTNTIVTGENVPTLYINGFAMFGGVDIK